MSPPTPDPYAGPLLIHCWCPRHCGPDRCNATAEDGLCDQCRRCCSQPRRPTSHPEHLRTWQAVGRDLRRAPAYLPGALELAHA